MSPKTDRLQLTTGALSTRYIIHESSKQRRDGREYMRQKPYARIVARLAPVPANYADVIPPFNPFKLYANNRPVDGQRRETRAPAAVLSRTDVSVKVVELLGGILPDEDGQELDAQEVQDLVERTPAEEAVETEQAAVAAARRRRAHRSRQLTALDSTLNARHPAKAAASEQLPNTTDIVKLPKRFDDPRRRYRRR